MRSGPRAGARARLAAPPRSRRRAQAREAPQATVPSRANRNASGDPRYPPRAPCADCARCPTARRPTPRWLGARIRLSGHWLDQGVSIRAMANRGAPGGRSAAALQAALLLDAAGRQDVFVETVGVGQAEIDIIGHADPIVLVLMPGSGDSIQALKAGVMEIPDVIVINKADHPLTDTMVREIRGVLSLAGAEPAPAGAPERWSVPIVKTEASSGEGVAELVQRLSEHRAHISAAGQLAERRRRNPR